MRNEVVFSETQRFKQIWIWAILLGVNGLFFYGVITQVFFGKTFGTKPMDDTGLILVMLFVMLLTIFFLYLRLDTTISKDGIHYRFMPFQREFRKVPWDSISKSYVRQYKPIREFGGWGLRTSFSGGGSAYNIAGNKGLQLVYHNGKKFLIGTQKPEEMKDVLKKLGKLSD